MSTVTLARDVRLEPGILVQWYEGFLVDESPLMLLSPCPAGWWAVRVRPEPWEEKRYKWLIARSQIEGGKYAVVGRVVARGERPAVEGREES